MAQNPDFKLKYFKVLLASDVIPADKIPELVDGVGVADVQAKRLAASKLAKLALDHHPLR